MTRTVGALTAGQTITHEAGNATITLQHTDTGTWTVTTHQGPTRINDWCRTYTTEGEARDAARHTARTFHTHGTDTAIEARRTALADTLAGQVRRMPRNMHDRRALAAAEAELETLATLADLALLEQLRWQFAEH